MKNMMKEYLGNEYSNNHLRNFCLYWIKGLECKDSYPSADKWRMENDLDCLYFDGDLKADTLMSAWTPVKWVADHINSDLGIVFYKINKTQADPYHDLKILADDSGVYLPPEHDLVKLLNRFLELAELRCNFILLPDRNMNTERYRCKIGNESVWLCDEVPATLSHLFDKQSLGKYFDDTESVINWIRREHLEMGFEDGKIDLYHVKPLVEGLVPYSPKWLTDENEITQALEYMIGFLETRMRVLTDIEVYGRDMSCGLGSVCTVSVESGCNKVARSIRGAYMKAISGTLMDKIDMIDFHIKGDISFTEETSIDSYIRRLREWYCSDPDIRFGYECKKDEAMDGTCSTTAIIHLKDDGVLQEAPDDSIIKEDGLIRPNGITSDVLWEVYKLFHNMHRPYLWVNTDGDPKGEYRLYLIKDAVFGFGKTEYGVGNMGIELPWSRKEWIDLKITSAYGNSGMVSTRRITVDAIMESYLTVEELLKKNNMKMTEGVCR